MIITNVCLLLEALSIVICLHHLYGEKFRLDIETICLLAVDMIMMQTIDYFKLPSILSILMYPMIIIYCIRKFGKNLKRLIVNNVLYMLIIGCIQFLLMLLIYLVCNKRIMSRLDMLLANVFIFAVVFFLLSKCNLYRISNYLQDTEKILIIILNVVICVILFCFINFKITNLFKMSQYIFLFAKY